MSNPSFTRLVEGDSDACSSCDYVSPGSSGDAYRSTSNHHRHKSFVNKRHIGDINNFDIALRISNAEEPTDVHDVYSSFNRIFGVLLVVKFKKTVGNVNVHARAQVVSNSVSASATASIQENPSETFVCPKENSTINNGNVYDIQGMDMPVPPIYNMNGDDDMRGAECLQSRDLSDNNSVNNSVEQIGRGCGDVDDMTQIGELSEIERQVVDRLISLGDIIEQKCGGEIDELLDSLRGIKSPTESLCRIAQLIFKEVRLNWGRILVFFYFGIRYFLRYAADYLAQDLVNLCSRVVSALRDICTAGIFQWIADHGGWIDFLRKNDEIFATKSKEFIETLTKFQQEFGQLTSVFEKNDSNANSDTSRRALVPTETSQAGKQDVREMLRDVLNNYTTTKEVVNPEISEKARVAESAAISKYLERMEFQRMVAEENASLKSYARPATGGNATNSANRRVGLDIKRRERGGDPWPDVKVPVSSAESDIEAELREMKDEIMGKLFSHDRLIECGRERLQRKLRERRVAATVAMDDLERSRAEAILSRQDEVEQNVDEMKMDMQRKLMSRIEQKLQNRVAVPQESEQ